MQRVTIKDLAKLANVSWKTVARVVNNEYGVSGEKRAEILRLIEETGFRPNWAGRALSGQRSHVIALVLRSRSKHYYNFEMQIGAMQACTSGGYHFVTEALEDYLADGPERVRTWLQELKPDGVIILAPISDDADLLNALDDSSVPYVRIAAGRDLTRGARVSVDDEAAAYDITKHLLDLGHTAIGYIGLGGVPAINALRQRGFERALADQDIKICDEWMPPPPDGHHDGFADAEIMLSGKTRPTAVVGASDSIAFGIIAAATKVGLSVPNDLSVVGFDNAPGSESIWPPLTTVNQPIRAIGRKAAEMLIAQCSDGVIPGGRNAVLDYEIVERQSTTRHV